MLPVIPRAKFTVKSKYLPNGKLELYPFNNGLESILLQAKDGTPAEQLEAMKQVIEECTVKKDINIDAIPLFAIEEIFLRMREKSAGEIIKSVYLCNNKYNVLDEVCGNRIEIPIDLRKVHIVEEKDHKNIFMVTDTIGIKMRYPTLSDLSETEDTKEAIFNRHLDCVFDGDTVYKKENIEPTELSTFYKNLDSMLTSDIFINFIYKIPHIHYSNSVKCSKCGFEHTVEFNSLQEVFS